MQSAAVHYGFAMTVQTARQTVFNKAYDDQPERFATDHPRPKCRPIRLD